MERRKLGEICEIVSGSTPKTEVAEYWDGDINWITPAELTDETYIIEESQRKITHTAVQKTGLKPFPKGTVILSSRAPIGKVAIAGKEMYCNQGFKNFICSDKIDNRYLYWYLKGHTDYLNSLGRGATFKEISKGIVENIEIPLPDLDEQIVCSNMLKKCWDLILLQKKQIEAYDTLIKSRFVEMFGEPVLNDKGFKTIVGKDFFKLSNGKAVSEEKRTLKGIPAWGGNGISWYTNQVLFENDTLVVGRVGFQSGNVHLAKGPLWITDNAMYISDLYIKDYDLIFLCALMEYIDFTRYQDAGDLKKITQKPFMEMKFIFPPIELQNQFSRFVRQVDKLKVEEQRELEKVQTLFDALMQKYFG